MLPILILAFAVQESTPTDTAQAEAPQAPRGQELLDAARALESAGSYRFEQVSTDQGGGQDARRRGGRGADGQRGSERPAGADAQDGAAETDAAPAPVKLTGQVQKGLPTHLQQGEVSGWRNAEGVFVYAGPDGAWTALDRRAMRRGGRGGGRGADAAPAGDMQAMRARMGLMRQRMPVDSLKQLAAGLAKYESVQPSVANGASSTVVINGVLNDEGLDAFGARLFAGRGRRGGADDAAAPQMTRSGHCRVELKDGQLVSMVVETVVSTSTGDGTVARTRRTELKLHDIGTTSLEVPTEVQEAFATAAATSAETAANEEEF